ncbi:MAG: LLM class flavin-dependent oxidoreductase, partial [Gammaproteobacteria bacterium]|nr:LLM class flavin-dependent oxidoreductase [Gammaproteobacteria bacterium]
MKLSVLDQSPIRSGSTAQAALEETFALAKQCDAQGYHRYWLAEHHASDALAGCSPEVLLGRLGAETSRIRIGSGGVMLPHYSPYKVAENFKVLQTLYPERVDLGVGRAPGTDPFTAAALRYGSTVGPQHFSQMVADLQALLNDSEPATRGMEGARAFPLVDVPPEMWMLGSSEDSAGFAADAGLPYSFAYFINPAIRTDIFELYRERFQPGPNLTEPHTSLCIFTICAETEEEAWRLSRSRDLWFVRLLQGAPGPVPTIEEATEYPYADSERQVLESNRHK